MVVFLTHNGLGLGHLSRALVLCNALESAGETPVLFTQGALPSYVAERYPAAAIRPLHKVSLNERFQLARNIVNYVQLFDDVVLMEDTHPSLLAPPIQVKSVLVVRPTSLEYLRKLSADYRDRYSTFILSDHPDSPTWPYDRDATREILTWPGWHILGPVYRPVESRQLDDVRRRYSIAPGQRVCVFTMGAGGQRKDEGRELAAFLDRSIDIGTRLRAVDPSCRLIFVRGIYFPSDAVLPQLFEDIAFEPCMPALLQLADGAVMRPGFNTTWECIQGATPFISIAGHSYFEPTAERLDHMRAENLYVDDLPARWFDTAWRAQFQLTCTRFTTRFPGSPDGESFKQVIHQAAKINSPRTTKLDKHPDVYSLLPLSGFQRRIDRLSSAPRLRIRIDDVTGLDDSLASFLALVSDLSLPVSLEVIPYASTLNAADLAPFEPALCEISQHGYSHLPRWPLHSSFSEFGEAPSQPTALELNQIASGRQRLIECFPDRFRGGYSSPFHQSPPWLSSVWKRLGGKFISGDQPLESTELPFLVFSVDAARICSSRFNSAPALLDALLDHFVQHGEAGLIVTRNFLRQARLREALASCLSTAAALGTVGQSVSARALSND